MIGSSSLALVVPVVLALVPASAGAGAGPPPVALTATPARVVLTGSARTTVRVRNSGTKRVAVDASRAGFALDLRGRPRIVWSGGARSAAGWLTLRPAHFTIGPAPDLLIGTTSAPSAAGGDVWASNVGFVSPLPVVPPGHYTATVTFTAIGR